MTEVEPEYDAETVTAGLYSLRGTELGKELEMAIRHGVGPASQEAVKKSVERGENEAAAQYVLRAAEN